MNVCRTLDFEPDALRLGIAELRRSADRLSAFRRERRHTTGTRTRVVASESGAEA